MTPAEFWNMPPFLFAQKVDGYFQRENRAGVYFRETFALHANINRREGSSPIAGKEVIQLYGEKPERKSRARSAAWTPKDIQAAVDKINAQEAAKREADMQTQMQDANNNQSGSPMAEIVFDY